MSIEVKEDIKSKIAKYIHYDNYIQKINTQLKPIIQKQQKIKREILNIAKANKIPKLEVNLPDSVLLLETSEKPQAINLKYITNSIHDYYMLNANSSNIDTKRAEADKLIKYILENREIRLTQKLDRKYI